MSGGSYNYAYSTVDEFAMRLRLDGLSADRSDRALRKAFRDHLVLVARAMRAIEWNDSGDGDDEEIALITQCLAPRPLDDVVRRALQDEIEEAAQLLAAAHERLTPRKEPA